MTSALNVFFLIFILFFNSFSALAKKRFCDYYKVGPCPSSLSSARGLSGASKPNQSAAFSSNPSQLNTDRGLGLETIVFGRTFGVGVTGGTGAIGSGFTVSNQEGTFFGNLTHEDQDIYRQRIRQGDVFDSPKYSGALAFKVGESKNADWMPVLNVGILGKYNELSDNMHPGAGASLQVGPIFGGISRYRDDFNREDVSLENQRFFVNTWSVGLNLSSLAMEYQVTTNSYLEDSIIRVFSSTLFIEQVMFTYAYRSERSEYPQYDFRDEEFEEGEQQHYFLGLQYGATENLLIGAFWNYFLLNEVSFGVSLFL